MSSARVRETGDVAEVLFYDPADPAMTYKLSLPDGRVDWFPAKSVEPLDALAAGAQPGAGQAGEQVRLGPSPPSPIRSPVPLHERLLPAPGPRRGQYRMSQLAYNVCCRDASACGNCVRLCIILAFLIGAVTVGVERNAGCSPEALISVPPPYGGELMPVNITLAERRQYFQLTKLVDVYDAADGRHVGYFYDMNLLFWMRFGFSDASDRIWFEARYPTLFARLFQLGVQYYLQRCDVGAGGRTGGIFDIKEDWWSRPWFCWNNCYKAFNLTRRQVGGAEHSDGASRNLPVANVIFNSTLEWYKSGWFWSARHKWYMNMTDPADGSVVAFAQQQFVMQHMGLGTIALSRWTVDVKEEEPYLPNWVVGFMAVLDDVTEEKR